MKPLISIIIPVYNGEAFVENCIKSVQEQSLKELQIITVDDGSSDQTLAILQKLAAKDSRIEIIHQKNGGVSKARNSGLSVVKGDWILFVDADDSVVSDYCAVMLDAALSLNIDVLVAHPYIEGKEEKYFLTEANKLIRACLSYDETSFSFNIDAPWGKLFRTSVIQQNRICFPETLTRSEDAFFCLSFYSKAKTMGALNQFGYIHNERDGSLCRSYAPNMVETLEMVLIENQNWVIVNHPNEAEYNRALWYRVLPGIVECERTYFLHRDNRSTCFRVAIEYQHFLNQKMVRQAIRYLKLSDVENKQYRVRLLLYKLHLGWFFILAKRK